MSDSMFSNYFEAIQELVEDNNNYMTPSPLDEQANQEEDQFTFVYPTEQNQHIPDYYKMSDEKKNLLSSSDDLALQQAKLYELFYANQNNMSFYSNPATTTTTTLNSVGNMPQLSYTTPLPASIDMIANQPSTPASTTVGDDEDDDDEAIIMNFRGDVSHFSEEFQKGASDIISDEDLITLPVRQLNMRLKNISKEEKSKLKSRRRLLKNRGYAQTCRERRITSQKSMAEQNEHLKKLLEKEVSEKNMYKTKYENLKNVIKKAKMDREKKRTESISN